MKGRIARCLIVVLLTTAGWPSSTRAAECGDGHEDAGEACDQGRFNGVGCCDRNCGWVADGAPCVPAPFDPCRQGRCEAEHLCVRPAAGYLDPCADTASCRTCVVTGKGTAGFACTGAPSPDGAACADDEGQNHLCTLDVCKDGKCMHPPKECPAAEGRSASRCDPKTGRCETAPGLPGTQSRRH